jgi:hypothetical protein
VKPVPYANNQGARIHCEVARAGLGHMETRFRSDLMLSHITKFLEKATQTWGHMLFAEFIMILQSTVSTAVLREYSRAQRSLSL